MSPHRVLLTLPLLVLMFVAPAGAQAQPSVAGGASLYGLYCTACHGARAKGDGPMAAMLSKRPADLTRLAQRNKGVFDAALVARVIDGRRPVKGHGGDDMPLWGDAFAKSSDSTPVEERIGRLVAYLESLQEP